MDCCKVLRRDGDKEDSFKEEYYRIGIFGGDRVGKNSLICQMINHFILDDYTNMYTCECTFRRDNFVVDGKPYSYEPMRCSPIVK